MSYGTLKTYEEVALKFEIKLEEQYFIQQKSISINNEILSLIQNNLQLRRNYVSESSICETMIFPNKVLKMDVISYSALENLPKLFNCLNWLFSEAKT